MLVVLFVHMSLFTGFPLFWENPGNSGEVRKFQIGLEKRRQDDDDGDDDHDDDDDDDGDDDDDDDDDADGDGGDDDDDDDDGDDDDDDDDDGDGDDDDRCVLLQLLLFPSIDCVRRLETEAEIRHVQAWSGGSMYTSRSWYERIIGLSTIYSCSDFSD